MHYESKTNNFYQIYLFDFFFTTFEYELINTKTMIVISTRNIRANQTKNKRDITSELKGALQEVKEYLEGKRELKSLDDLIKEL